MPQKGIGPTRKEFFPRRGEKKHLGKGRHKLTAKKILATTNNPTSPETRAGKTYPLTEVSKKEETGN